LSCCLGNEGESSPNLRFEDWGRGNGDEESGSKAGSSDGFGVGSARCSTES
jgi:hypothetical protein